MTGRVECWRPLPGDSALRNSQTMIDGRLRDVCKRLRKRCINVIYLAKHDWRATGVDFSAAAIKSARRAADGITGATFLEGDVSKLSALHQTRRNPDAFSPYFIIERSEPKNFPFRRKLLRYTIIAHWYWLRRR